MEEKTFQRIKGLTELQETSGFGQGVRAYMEGHVEPLVDELQLGGLGGVFNLRRHEEADAPRVIAATHMNEVGFMLTQVQENRLFKVVPLGGWSPYVTSAQRFTLEASTDENYSYISSSIPPHLLRRTNGQKSVEATDVLFDTGLESREEAMGYGVLPGDTIIPYAETIKAANGKNIISKSWNNRYDCTMVLEALEALQNETLGHTLIAGAGIQEEVGLRGSKASVSKFKPDLFFTVGCSTADGTVTKNGTFGYLGEGTLMRIQDPGLIMLPRLRKYLLDIVETNNIPYRYFVSEGGTDAGVTHTQNEGVPSTVIGVVGHYIYTHQTMFSIRDSGTAREMLIQTLKGLDKSTANTIVYGK